MRRINAVGCGYSLTPGESYQCNGVPKFKSLFATTPTDIYGASAIRSTSGGGAYKTKDWVGDPDNLLQGSIDNYSQIPQEFEGFVMTLTPVINMAGSPAVGPEVPELECRINLDPFNAVADSVLNVGDGYSDPGYTVDPSTKNDGFLNLYNTVNPDYTETVYVDVKDMQNDAQLIHGSTQRVYYDMPAYVSGQASYVPYIGYKIVGPHAKLTAGPGILEPMLDTSFPPVGVDTITGPDIIGDFTMWEFNTIAQWQKTVDARLNSLTISIPTVDYGGIDGLLNLENQKNKQSPCSNFNISISTYADLSFKNPLIKRIPPKAEDIPTYTVGGGTVLINGSTVAVESLSDITAPADIYLDVIPVVVDTEITGYTAAVRAYSAAGFNRVAQHKYVYVGRITLNTNAGSNVKGFGHGYPFTFYEIQQGECIYSIDVDKKAEKDEYPGPFAVKYGLYSGSNTVYVTGFDRDGTTSKIYAGKIFIDGQLAYTKEQRNVTGLSAASGFVYAHILLAKTKDGYEYDSCIFDTSESYTPPEAEQEDVDVPFVYTIRLGKITYADGTYTTEQIHYGDLYLDTNSIESSGGETIYSGPFHIQTGTTSGTDKENALCVVGVDENQKAGKIYIDGEFASFANPGDVIQNSDISKKFVYAHVYLTKTIDGYEYHSCTYDMKDTNVSQIAGKAVYTVRLGQVAGTGADKTIKQYHYGDIYVDTQMLATPNYEGPFRVMNSFAADETTPTIDILGCVATQVSGQPAGIIYINGSSVGTLPIVLQMPVSSGAGFVYAHIGVKKTDGVYTMVSGSTYTFVDNTEVADADYTYHVRLARMVSPEAVQIHYGDIYIDTATFEYDGPFKVKESDTSTAATPLVDVTGIDTIDSVKYAGDIYINGAYAGRVQESLGLSVSGTQYVYVHVGLVPDAAGTSYSVSGSTINTTASTDISGASVTYHARLAKVTGSYIQQIQYGDLDIDLDPSAEYSGPFKVVGVQGAAAASVSLYAFDGEIDGYNRTGKVIMDAPINSTTEEQTTTTTASFNPYNAKCGSAISLAGVNSATIYAHVLLIPDSETSTETLHTYKVTDVIFDKTADYNITAGSSISKVYTFRIAAVTVSHSGTGANTKYTTKVTQIQYGDIYLGDVSETIATGGTSEYDGPFQLTKSGSVACPICITPSGQSTTVGYFSINGDNPFEHRVSTENIALSLVNGRNDIWLNIKPTTTTTPASGDTPATTTTTVGATISSERDTAANCYTVLLGAIIRTYDQTTQEYTYEPKQMHYGNVQVDGRWS